MEIPFLSNPRRVRPGTNSHYEPPTRLESPLGPANPSLSSGRRHLLEPLSAKLVLPSIHAHERQKKANFDARIGGKAQHRSIDLRGDLNCRALTCPATQSMDTVRHGSGSPAKNAPPAPAVAERPIDRPPYLRRTGALIYLVSLHAHARHRQASAHIVLYPPSS